MSDSLKRMFIMVSVFIVVTISILLTIGHKETVVADKEVSKDTVSAVLSRPIAKNDTVVEADDIDDLIYPYKNKPLPLTTKFKVSDIVCVVYEDVTGVVQSIRWSANSDKVLVYRVRLFRNLDDEDEDLTYDYNEYYDTELTLGKCN